MSASLVLNWFLNHLWQSTVFAALAAGLIGLFRSNSAAVRHNIWLVASLKFLLPFSVIVALGQRMDWRHIPTTSPMTPISAVSAPVSETTTPGVFDAIRQPLSLAAPVAAPASGLTFSGRGPLIVKVLVALWLLGVLFHLVAWLRQWLSIRARLRTATPLELDVPARIPALSSSASIEPCVFGMLRPVLLLPDRITTELSAAQIESILLHESAHVSRRDNLGAALHMIVECLFWFHPMVWWIGRRMAEERERACDEQVLRRFDEPEVYAEAILHVCKRHLKSPLACMAGVASSNLRERVESIMNYRNPRRLNLGHKLMLSAAVVASALGPLFVGLTEARQVFPAAEVFMFSSIEVPGSTSTTARGINNLGQIVGSFVDSSGTHAFLFNNGRFSSIDVPGSTWTIATGINNIGQIVGGYGSGGETGNHGFLLSNGALSTIDSPGSLDTVAYGINNKGQIAGAYFGNDNYRHGFRLSGGNYTLIEVPGSRAGSARGINDSGQITGLSGFSANATGFILTGETYTRVDSSPNVYLEPMGLNNLGDVVGQEGAPLAPFHGFIRSASATALSLPGDPFAWNIQGINDLGQAVGEFIGRDGKTLGYLATPKALSTSGTGRPDQPPFRVTNLGPDPTPNETPATAPSTFGSDSTEPRINVRGPAATPLSLPLYADPVALWSLASGGNGHWYQAVFAPGRVNWTDAQAWAVAHGGHLASIGSAEENDFVFRLIQDPHFWRQGPAGNFFLGPWLGGALQTDSRNSPSAPGDWRWVDDNQPFTFTNWGPGQPDAGTVSGVVMNFMSAVDIGFRPTWNDMRSIDQTNGFVVEYANGLASAAPANPAPRALPSGSNMTAPRIVDLGDAPVNGERTLSGALNMLADGLDNRIRGTNPANVERLQHLNNARALALNDLKRMDAARISTDTTSRATAPDAARRFELPDELQGVDPALIGSYNVLPVAANTLARSSGDPEVRARIAGDLDTIGNEIVAALAASKAFNSAANGRGARRGQVAGGGETLVAALSFVSNRLDYVTNTTRAANVERLRHLNNARAIAGRALADEPAAAGSAANTPGGPQTTQRFQLPDDLQGVDPGLIGIYDSLNNAANALARSSGDPAARARIAGDLDTMGKEILAALIASKEFDGGRGRGGRGGEQAPNPK